MSQPTERRRHIALWLLGLVAVVSYVDRQAFSVLQDDIKREFQLTDTALSLLSGPAFAVIFALASLPIARLADRLDRPLIISISLAVWSLATALSSIVGSVWHMVAARMSVAVGEAGSGPASLSLLTDIFPPERRGFVIGFYQSANAIGLSLGVAIAAGLAAFLPWRTVFIALGLPGLLLAIIVFLFVIEPRRGGITAAALETEPHATLLEALAFMGRCPPLRWFALMCVSIPVTGFAVIMWSPSFLQRVHGFSKAELGWLGLAILLGLVAGNLAAGWIGDKFGSRNLRFNAQFAGLGLLAAFPFALGFALLPDATGALGALVIMKFTMTLWLPPMMKVALSLVPSTMRATTSALISLFIILSGVGFGTYAAGALSDAYAATYGDQSLRYSLATTTVGLLIGAFAAFMAARKLPTEEQAAPAPAGG